MNRTSNRLFRIFRNRWVVATTAFLIGLFVLGFGAGYTTYRASEQELAAIHRLRHHNPTNTSFMWSRAAAAPGELGDLGDPFDGSPLDGSPLDEDLFGSDPFAVRWVEIDSISPILVCSVVKSEDTNFFEHGGFAWQELARAVLRHVRGQFGGGSTISQQLAKNLFLGSEISLQRKLREALITWRMERTLSKERILEIYLNVIEWGEGVWGISAASRHYFAESPAGLDAFQAVFLTSLIPAPLEPFTGWNLQRFQVSNRRILDRIYNSGLISESEWSEARPRLESVHASVADGRSALESLARAESWDGPSLPRAPARYQPNPLPLTAALAESCGRDRERAEDIMRRAAERQRQRAGKPRDGVAASPRWAPTGSAH